MNVERNGAVSFWYADIGGVPAKRKSLSGPISTDVAIVGAGYTGLWTAYYLKKSSPGLRIVILEKEFAGFGASGRNGGWLSGEMSWSRRRYAERAGQAAVALLDRQMSASVEEVLSVCRDEGIDADILQPGSMVVATNPAQLSRLRAAFAAKESWKIGEPAAEWIGKDELRNRINVDGALGAVHTLNTARIQPAKLVRGLAEAVERLGVEIYEDTVVEEIRPGVAVTTQGDVSAGFVVQATEGFTASLAGKGREWLPMNSAMIATEPLTPAQWAELGWEGGELLSDAAHGYIYAQRSREGRIAIGGRGVPYRFGSRTDIEGATQAATIRMLEEALVRLFPSLQGVTVDHAWCGVLGVPRDWCATVGLDKDSGIGWAGGYVGTGVSTSNLAARTLRNLILGIDGPESYLPWVDKRVRKWEPEPLRWLGVQALYSLYRVADRREGGSVRPKTSVLAQVANRVAGRR